MNAKGSLRIPYDADPAGAVYTEDDVEWLNLCLILRASGMPLPAVRRYTDLARQGAGNEEERLTLLRRHQEHVISQIGQLTRCLDLINYKVGVYEDLLTQGGTDHPCSAPAVSDNEGQD